MSSPKFENKARRFYPTAFCEALHVAPATYLVCFLQFLSLVGFGVLYGVLEASHFVVCVSFLRPVVAAVLVVALVGVACSVLGVSQEREALISVHISALTALIVVADAVALGIVFIMAIGKRSSWTHGLIPSLLSEPAWEALLGPFWLYLLAISLHITAAANMCALQVVKRYALFLKEKSTYRVSDETRDVFSSLSHKNE